MLSIIGELVLSNFKFGNLQKFVKLPFKNLAEIFHYIILLTQWFKSQQANEQVTGVGEGLIFR